MKIKKDEQGKYVRVDGWIARPPSTTVFDVGDEVRGYHPPGQIGTITRVKDNVREYWVVDKVYWWHPIEGKGPGSKRLRDYDREGNFGDVFVTEEEWIKNPSIMRKRERA